MTDDYFIDLVFYNYILKCFFLIDLKMGKVTHKDVGQMDMYRRMFDDQICGKDDNPTVGIVLCDETGAAAGGRLENLRAFGVASTLRRGDVQELRTVVWTFPLVGQRKPFRGDGNASCDGCGCERVRLASADAR